TYEGTATFVSPHAIRVGDSELTAERILIATGSRTAVPPIEGIEDVDWLDHVSALELTELPASLLVVGAGAVGLEFGQAFSRFGSQVTIVGRRWPARSHGWRSPRRWCRSRPRRPCPGSSSATRPTGSCRTSRSRRPATG